MSPLARAHGLWFACGRLYRGASGILVTPDGSRADVALTGDNAVAVINLATVTEEARLNSGSGPDEMAWLPGKP